MNRNNHHKWAVVRSEPLRGIGATSWRIQSTHKTEAAAKRAKGDDWQCRVYLTADAEKAGLGQYRDVRRFWKTTT